MNILSLQKRKNDIIPIALYLLNKLSQRDNVTEYQINSKVMKIMTQYTWTGNIRELKNYLLREISYLPENQLEIHNIPNDLLPPKENENLIQNTQNSNNSIEYQNIKLKPLWEIERNAIITTLKYFNGNRNHTAQLLQISRNTLYRKIHEYNININMIDK